MNYIQITIPVTDTSLQEILIAHLGEEGYEGFEERTGDLLAFIPEGSFDAARLEALLGDYSLGYTRRDLPGRNWNEEWEKNFDPVIVDGFCGIRAAFHAPVKGVKYELLITPKMSFGTGHHATTYMMLAAMQHLDFKGRRVLDFGTGTGVLAILADQLGAGEVLAIDNDDWSIENARENVAENRCAGVTVLKADKIPTGHQFDIILANINKHVIIGELSAMVQQLSDKGVILLSGLLNEDFEDVEKEVVANSYSISERVAKGNWICLKVEKKGK